MAYLIREGDPTTTGGTVLAGYPEMTVEGRPAARITDPVWCPACQRVGQIAEGHPGFVHGNQYAALEGYRVQCGCPQGSNRLIATQSLFKVRDLPPHSMPDDALLQGHTITPQWAEAIRQHAMANEPPPAVLAPWHTGQTATAPGFHIVQNPISRTALETILFGAGNPALLAHFRRLNPQFTLCAKPGQLIVLSDPRNPQCAREEAMLMEAAAAVSCALEPMSHEEAAFMVRYQGEIATMLALTGVSIGMGDAMIVSHFEAIESVLREMQALHKKCCARDGNLGSAAFFAERQQLFTKLGARLNVLTNQGIGFADHPDLKRALGVSTRSRVHPWRDAGSVGQMPGYATHIGAVAKAARYMKLGGWIGTVASACLNIKDVCTAGPVNVCENVRFTESSSFLGSVGTHLVAGEPGTASSAGTCIAIGLPTATIGALTCALINVTTANTTRTSAWEPLGECIGEVIHARTP